MVGIGVGGNSLALPSTKPEADKQAKRTKVRGDLGCCNGGLPPRRPLAIATHQANLRVAARAEAARQLPADLNLVVGVHRGRRQRLRLARLGAPHETGWSAA